MSDFPRYTNWTYQIEIQTGSSEDTRRVEDHYRSYGHHVQFVRFPNPGENDGSVVLVGSGKVFGIAEREFPDMPVTFHQLSKPVGFEPGEWVALPRVGIVGKFGWEYGHNARHSDGSGTSINLSVGSATWTARADLVVKLSDLSPKAQAELVSIGERQAADWEKLHGGKDDPTMRPDRKRVNKLTRAAYAALLAPA
jgi:hypothetical protein